LALHLLFSVSRWDIIERSSCFFFIYSSRSISSWILIWLTYEASSILDCYDSISFFLRYKSTYFCHKSFASSTRSINQFCFSSSFILKALSYSCCKFSYSFCSFSSITFRYFFSCTCLSSSSFISFFLILASSSFLLISSWCNCALYLRISAH